MAAVPQGTARTWLVVCCLLGGGWLLFALYAYPGYMSFDSGWQLREARAGVFTDWHPPAMALLWRWIDVIYPGPLGMLVVQSGCFLAGAFLVLRSLMRPIAAAGVAACVLLFPPVATTMAVIWKDSLMTGFLLLGCGIALSSTRRRALACAVLLFVLASAMRHNAFTITFALVALLLPCKRVYAVVLWIAITLGGFGLNRVLTDEATHPWHGSLAMFDIVGTIRYAPPLDDDQLREILAGTPLPVERDLQARAVKVYKPDEGVFSILNRDYMRQPTNDVERAAIARAWRTLTTTYPLAYLRHRWHAYRELLQLSKRDWQSVWIGFDGQAGYRHHAGPVQAKLQRLAAWIGNSWLMRPYLYLLLLGALLPFCFASRVALALTASAILSELALFFVSPTPDFRYSIWLVVCGLIVPILLVTARARAASRDAPLPDRHGWRCAVRSRSG